MPLRAHCRSAKPRHGHPPRAQLSGSRPAFNDRLAEAARKTNAWVFSCGERSNHSAQLAGHARLFGANLGYDSPYIAVIASERMREEMVDHPNQDGKVHLYSGPGTRPMTPRGEGHGAPSQGPKVD